MMALYADPGGHVAKRPRVDFPASAVSLANIQSAIHLNTTATVNQAGLLSQQYIEQQLTRKSNEPEKPNHILLFTVLNPTYPITCEVLHTICAPIGSVLRIVIFKKNGVQAMVEFDSIETAKTAKESLHGCDIYSGCCTLKIEYAKPTKLNVYKNDAESHDYTNPNLGKKALEVPQQPVSHRPVLLKEPPRNNNNTNTAVNGNNGMLTQTALRTTPELPNGYSPPHMANGGVASIDPASMTASQANGAAMGGIGRCAAAALGQVNVIRGGGGGPILATTPISVPTSAGGTVGAPAQGSLHQGAVCMVYGLSADKMNANRIFNLFCLYGNVVRVKFLKTKEGCAMVQMGDALAVERVVSNLNNTTFFGNKMQLGFSKQAFLADVQSPYQLTDGSPSFQDFMGSKNNRFINPEMASKNRIQPPSKILHFFNTPPGLEAADIEAIFCDKHAPKPKCVKMFPSKTERSSSGLIEFETLSDALEGLVSCNHHPVPNPNGKFPYIMKLCFSSSKSIPTTIR